MRAMRTVPGGAAATGPGAPASPAGEDGPFGALPARLRRVRAAMAALDLDGLLVVHLPNVRYLTGMRASAAAVLVAATDVTLISDARYATAARDLVEAAGDRTGLTFVEAPGSYDEAIRDAVVARGLRRVGFEAEHLSVARWRWLCGALAERAALVETAGLVETGRMVKDAAERRRFRRAGRMLAGVVPAALAHARAGRTEREVAADIEREMTLAGFEDRAFETIVASGPQSALPHARPGSRRLAAGDLVVLDFGGVYDGYCVDLTRTASVGEPAAPARRLHAAVLAAQQAAIAALRPGVRASAVDAAARGVLRERGLADAFRHGTGHGLGLEVHEAPRIASAARLQAPGADVALAAGMVVTIEPGVYLPGVGGVRIEDDLLVTAGGCELLTDAPRALAVC